MSLMLIPSMRDSGASASAGKAVGGPQQPRLASLSEAVVVEAAGRGYPWINLRDGREVVAAYGGDSSGLDQLLAAGEARALALAAADFDEDGVRDLISTYAGQGTGLVTLHRGNMDSIYPNTPEAYQRRLAGTFTDSPFLSPAQVFGLSSSPDFVVAGDFDGDGHQDVATATRGGSALYFLAGDGRGTLGEARAYALPGGVTSLVSGEINRADGIADLVVAIDGSEGARALVFEGPEGAIKSRPEELALPAEAHDLALGYLNDDHSADLAVAAGRELVIIEGRDRKLSLDARARENVARPVITRHALDAAPRSLAIGDFTGDHRDELAVMCDDGSVLLLKAEQKRGRANKHAGWQPQTLSAGTGRKEGRLLRTRVSVLKHDTLVMADRTDKRLHIWLDGAEKTERINDGATPAALAVTGPVSMEVEGEPVAVLPMRLNVDALTDLVVLRGGATAPSVMLTQTNQTFCVTDVNDTCNPSSTSCNSLRAAITRANQAPGSSTISFDLSGARRIALTGPLPPINVALVFDTSETCTPSLTNPQQAGTSLEIDGGDFIQVGLNIFGGSSTLRGVVLNRFRGSALNLGSGFHIVEGSTSLNSDVGVRAGSRGNQIGGAAAPARNTVGSSVIYGINIAGFGANDNIVQGNSIGVTGGNAQNGVIITNQAARNVIGGTEPNAGNIITSSGLDGVLINNSTGGNIIQGNQVAFNGGSGIATSTRANTIGGTALLARNKIWRNAKSGVEISGAGENLILGNLIGTDIDSQNNLLDQANSQHGIALINNAVSNAIGGNFDGAANLIGFNRADGVTVESGRLNSILSNLFFLNAGLDIDLGDDGPTPNDPGDADTGPNDRQNFPVLSAAAASVVETAGAVTPSATSSITVALNSTPNTLFTMQMFFNVFCQGTGQIATRPTLLETRRVSTDAGGNLAFTFSFTIPEGKTSGFVSATATGPDGNTSEFSPCLSIGTPAQQCTLNCPAPQGATAPSAAGAVISYPQPTLSGCTGLSITCLPASGSTFPVGATTVNCTAREGTTTRATCSFSVVVAPPPPQSLQINAAVRDKKKLIVTGTGFANGAVILLNGASEKTSNDAAAPSTRLIGKKAGKKAQPNDRIQVRNPNGQLSNEIRYTP